MTQRMQLLRWGFWFSAISGLILTLVATRFLEYMPEIEGFKAGYFLATGIFSHFSLITLLVFVLFVLPFAVLLPFAGFVMRHLLVLVATLGTVLLIADTLVYAQYRFHITGFIFDMLIQAGDDVIAVSWVTWLITISTLVATYALYWFINKKLWQHIESAVWARLKYKYLSVFFVALLSSHLIHLVSDAQYDQRVTSLVRHIPLFSPATAKEKLLSSGLVDAQSIRANKQDFSHKSGSLVNYPSQPLETSINGKPLNVLLIVLDTARFDIVEPNVMPILSEFAQGNSVQVYNEHMSGGNGTRTGIFNLFYGLPGTYWGAFSANQVPPVLMSSFQKHGYELGVYAAAPLTQPAFDRTVFAGVKDLKLRADGNLPWELDENLTDNWLKFIEEKAQLPEADFKPFFGFLFYDGIHGTSLPEGAEKPFQPSWNRVDHLSLNKDFDSTAYFNLYKNSAFQVDKQLKRVFDQLNEKNLLDETIVIVTSDHGQEFNDNKMNYWGHGSNFTPAQIHVPLVIHWPGKERQVVSHRTSHSDISTTLMKDLFNVANNTEDYSLGYHLQDTNRNGWTIAGSYVNYAILEEDRHIVTYQSGNYEILDQSARPAKDQTLSPQLSVEVMEALSRFYQ
jgi:membrane-anchored protein YejM (alkaline phosphatase superfamily)